MALNLPTPERKARLQQIHRALARYKQENDDSGLQSAVMKMLEDSAFKKHLLASENPKPVVKSQADCLDLAWKYFYMLLYARDYVAAAYMIWGPKTFTIEPWAAQLIWEGLFDHNLVNVMGCGSVGKCLGPEVPVLMFDGSVKPAASVRVGDKLMGDDGTVRNVLAANPGHGPMYRIVPERGTPWTCNGDHILSLRCAYNRFNGNGSLSINRTKGAVVDVPISEYLNWGKNRKEQFMQFHVGVDFPEAYVQFDPYIYGAWIGDGSFDIPAIHKPDGPMVRKWVSYFESLPGFRVSVGYLNKCPMWCARTGSVDGGGGKPNPFTEFIRTSRCGEEKIILPEYLQNSRENRMKLLAGLIDSDGGVEGHGYSITSKSRNLTDQICWLARSLGYAATVRKTIKTIKSINFSGTYWRLNITGTGITKIPTLQKKATESVSKKNSLNTGFKVESIGDGDYYGFVIDGNHRFLLGDFTVTHNTFSPAAWCLLDWVLDPEWTRVSLISNSEDHVKKNLFADFVRLHSESVLDLPGKVDTESISLDKKRAMGIFILTIPGGLVPRGKMKGSKIKNRPAHPLFGENSRIRFILDEAQEVPPVIFDEIPNILSSVDNSVEHIKILAAANPKDEWSKYGQNCTPIGGWSKITSLQKTWESNTGWWTISINAMLTENVMQRKTIFPRMITWEGVQMIIRSQASGDDQHPIVFTYVYGRFPPSGLSAAIIKRVHLTASEGDWIFDTVAENFAGHDPAFTGDDPALAFGRVGRAIGWLDFNGVRHDLPEPKIAIQIDADTILPRGDTQELVNEGLDRMKHLGVKPEHYGIDRTGSGQGVYDISRRQWREKVGGTDELAPVIGIHYSESPSEMKIADEDTKTPLEMYDRVASELWFAAAKLFECDCIRIGRGVSSRAIQELAGRCGGMKTGLGKKLSVEGKDAYKARTGGKSPDAADSVLIMLTVARLNTPGLIPKAKDTELIPVSGPRVRPWSGFNLAFDGAQMNGLEAGETIDMMKD